MGGGHRRKVWPGADARVAVIAAYVRTHYARHLTNAELARLVGISPSYMTRMFRHVMRMGPRSYIRRVRMGAAIRLSRAGHSQREIASLIGFANKSHLSRSFRQTFGKPLGAYLRERIR